MTKLLSLISGRQQKLGSINQHVAAIGKALLIAATLVILDAANASPPNNLNGLWLTDGYRQLIEIRGDTLSIYQLTKSSCLQGLTAKRSNDGAGVHEARFLGSEFNQDISSQDDFRLRYGRDNNHLNMHTVGAIADVELMRVNVKPAPCLQPPLADTPINNFDVFTSTYAENYPFFRLKNVDWDRVTAMYRQRVTSETTPTQLLEIFKSMFLPLQDAHTYIDAVSLKDGAGGGVHQSRLRKCGRPKRYRSSMATMCVAP
jgi:hypothetical protein